MEACWAHNPEVRGSKPRSANLLFFFSFFLIISFFFCLFVDGHESNLSYELTINQSINSRFFLFFFCFVFSIINKKMGFVLQLMFLLWP